MTKPVRPRDAASLVLVRQTSDGPAVLMGRRARRHRFVPDMFVFPGGALELGDRTAPVLSPLDPAIERQLGPTARTYAVAALRETWEETGLLVGRMQDQRPAWDLAPLQLRMRAITPPFSPIRFHARFFFVDAAAAKGDIGGNGELHDLDYYPLARALKLPLVDVQEYLLNAMLKGEGLGPDAHGRVPLFAYRRRAAYIAWK